MQKHLADFHHQPGFGNLPLHRQRGQQGGIAGDARPAVHTQGLVHSGNQEEQPHLRIFQDVAQTIQAVVAGTVRNEQGVVVEHRHKPGGIALGRDIAPALPPGRSHHQEGAVGDEVARVGVQRGHLLSARRAGLRGGPERSERSKGGP